MKQLLDALQEGRLIELPVNEKNKALEFMALMLEAVPDIGSDMDIVKEILERENTANTGIGFGVACPHARTKRDGDLLCAVGWSPQGIDYGAIDGKKVHLIVTYYIPDNQRNNYLKELSGLAKAVKETSGIESIESIEELSDIQSVRNHLLDWVEISMEKAQPITKARMIKLEAIQVATLDTPPVVKTPPLPVAVIPFYLLMKGDNVTVLSQNVEFTKTIEKMEDANKIFASNVEFLFNEYQISIISTRQFPIDRYFLECVAVKLTNP